MTFEANRPVLTLGGVPLCKGCYLMNGEEELTRVEPERDAGYAYFDGKTLTLHKYEYYGDGCPYGENSVGLLLPAGKINIRLEGDSTITVDAVTRGVGLWATAGARGVLRGKGSLTIRAQNGMQGSLGVGGGGSLRVKSGTLRVSAGLPGYTMENGKRRYAGESYAVNIADFVDKGARISGNDRRGNWVNKNNSAQVVYAARHRFPILPVLLVAVMLAAGGVTAWALFLRSPEVLTPDYAPVFKEQYAEEIPDEAQEDKLETPEGGGAIGVTYSMDVSIDRAAGMVTLYVANPSRSTQDMVLQLVIKEEIVAQSGTLNPGKQVQQLQLLDGAADLLQPGGYDGLVRVLAYNPDTGEKAIMSTDIAVNVTVQ